MSVGPKDEQNLQQPRTLQTLSNFEQTFEKDEEFQITPANIYNEATNARAARVVASIQDNMTAGFNRYQSMKDTKERLFARMKDCHSDFVQTLLKGEENGHCSGIKKRMDPTTRYRL